MNLLVEHLTVFRVFALVIAARFGWVLAGILLDQLEHWIDLALAWVSEQSAARRRLLDWHARQPVKPLPHP
jgi:hypothetical protein